MELKLNVQFTYVNLTNLDDDGDDDDGDDA